MPNLISLYLITLLLFLFFFNDPATTEIYTLSLHDALPILRGVALERRHHLVGIDRALRRLDHAEHERAAGAGVRQAPPKARPASRRARRHERAERPGREQVDHDARRRELGDLLGQVVRRRQHLHVMPVEGLLVPAVRDVDHDQRPPSGLDLPHARARRGRARRGWRRHGHHPHWLTRGRRQGWGRRRGWRRRRRPRGSEPLLLRAQPLELGGLLLHLCVAAGKARLELAERGPRRAERARELRPLLPLADERLAQARVGGQPGGRTGGDAIALRLGRRQRLAQAVALRCERLEARGERGHVRVALAARSRRPPQLLAQALHLARQVAQARGGGQLARPSLAEGDLEPVLLGVRPPRFVLERERDRPRRGVRLPQRLDLGGRRRQRLLGRPRPLPRLVHRLLAVQALAPARRLALLAQALLARGGRKELADELGVRLILLVELGADTRQSLLGLLGARAQALDLAR